MLSNRNGSFRGSGEEDGSSEKLVEVESPIEVTRGSVAFIDGEGQGGGVLSGGQGEGMMHDEGGEAFFSVGGAKSHISDFKALLRGLRGEQEGAGRFLAMEEE